MSSSPPFPLYFHFHRPPSYVVFLSPRHICPSHFNLHSLNVFAISPTFVVPPYFSFLILYSFVTLHIHRSILISATSDSFPVSSSMHSACPTTVLYTLIPLDLHVRFPVAQHSRQSLPVLPLILHSVGDFRVHTPPTSIPGM